MSHTVKRTIIVSAALVGFISVIVLIILYYNSPLKKRDSVLQGRENHLFLITNGESVIRVGKNLRVNGHIRSERFFVMMVRMRHLAGEIKAGEYYIEPSLSTFQIIDILTEGRVITQRFTVPEGLHMRQIADVLEQAGIVGVDEFLEACHDDTLLKKYGIPFQSAEGYLYPDTYVVAKGLSAEQIVTIMIEHFFKEISLLISSGYTEEELGKVVIIASLVEREAKIDNERALIAAVFYNRLMNEKRLESCATVQYVLGKTKERLLYSDLKVESPYNTYLHKGLPPGPIANPGVSSIRAAMYPADVDYLFFVSKHDGSHYFSTTYNEHLKAIEKYNKSGTVGHQIS